MDSPLVNTERSESRIIIRLSRPDKLNALSREMISELTEIFANLRSQSSLRAVIITGAGDKAFCAGTDISELQGLNEAEATAASQRGQQLCNLIESCRIPVIAAINGVAAGGGCELALACHLRIASPNAQFSLPETKLGAIPGYGGTARLAREIGHGRALDLMLTGRTLSADEALQFGLINRISPAGKLIDEAEELAARIAKLAPLAIRACLEAVTAGADLPLDEGLKLETKLFSSLFNTDDVREGTKAFLQKRKPNFSGK